MNNSRMNIDNQPALVKLEILKRKMHHCASSLGSMIQRVKDEPKLEMLYSGIKENSVGVVVGPSKAGKTMYCENLGMAMAAGEDNYLGLPINMQNRKVLFISLEEYYSNRTERNSKQVARLVQKYGDEWMENYVVVNENIPRYIITKEHWQELADIISDVEPGIVFIDSLTHMYQGAIEDSKVAVDLMKNLRNLSEETGTTIVAIHHTHKMYGQRLSIDTIAGSRVVAQELDFMIGLNRTPDGQKYIKDVAFRYVASNDDTVRTYEIADDCWLNVTGMTDEKKILSAPDGRKDDSTKNMILDFFSQQKEAGVEIVPASDLLDQFVARGDVTRTTVFNNINKLLEERIVVRFGKGAYSLAA